MKTPTFATFEELCDFCSAIPKQIKKGSRWTRLDIRDDPRGKNDIAARYLDDGVAIFMINHKSGIKGIFTPHKKSQKNQSRRHKICHYTNETPVLKEIKSENSEQELSDIQSRASLLAASFWENASSYAGGHPYLIKKRVDKFAYGLCRVMSLRVARNIVRDAQMSCSFLSRLTDSDLLVIPMKSQVESNSIHTLQLIDATGQKRFLSGGKKKAAMYCQLLEDLDHEEAGIIGLCEGFATGLSIAGCFGSDGLLAPVACAMDAGNLLSCATELRREFPFADIRLFSDVDASSTGQNSSLAAAEAVRGSVAFAIANDAETAVFKKMFGEDAVCTDWNDLLIARGEL